MTAVDPAELSSNRSIAPRALVLDDARPSRHPELCFDDGNVVILAGSTYFIVHQGPLSRHSPVFQNLIEELSLKEPPRIEDLPALVVSYTAEEMSHLIRTLYG